ncbi:serine/arginine repetitive matrix protein 2-like [Triticum aestivum]|uniref:serine/arginine repetitive matrix protein 2-like n=1 Tax=Triticum aestivum TaxID=4565 RepID=UPI001D034151|nr:serine/arginine repetitive matrix protein 2-like [Triticum aestivum]
MAGGLAGRRRRNMAGGSGDVLSGFRGGGPGGWQLVKLGLPAAAWRGVPVQGGSVTAICYGLIRIREGDERAGSISVALTACKKTPHVRATSHALDCTPYYARLTALVCGRPPSLRRRRSIPLPPQHAGSCLSRRLSAVKERAPDLRRSRPTARRATRSATRRDRLSASALALPDRSPRRRRSQIGDAPPYVTADSRVLVKEVSLRGGGNQGLPDPRLLPHISGGDSDKFRHHEATGTRRMRREGFWRQERRRRPRGQGLRREKRWRWPQRQGWPGRQDAQGPWSWRRGKGRARHEGREQGDRGAAQARRRLHHQGQGGPALHQEHGRRVVRLRREERLRPAYSVICSITEFMIL